MRFALDNQPIEFAEGDSVAVAVVRAGQHPQHGGALCLTGDCGNCSADVDGTPWSRTCLTPARPGLTVRRHPAVGAPPLQLTAPANPTQAPVHSAIDVVRVHTDLVVIGAGRSGTAEATAAQAVGRDVMVLDGATGHDVVGVYPGPLVIVRLHGAAGDGLMHVHGHEVVIATGSADLHPVCDGNMLRGILTQGAAAQLRAAGVELPNPVEVDLADLVRFDGADGWVAAVVTADGTSQPCRTAIVTSTLRAPRDLLARMTNEPAVRVVGSAATAYELPACPTSGAVCPCSKINVEDLQGVWDRGFQHIELVKRAALCGTGTCQGAVCMPHLRAFVTEKSGEPAAPFTGRPASRQLSIAEAASEVYLDAFRRSPLHFEHLALGAQMDRFGGWWRPWNYGDHVAEYWAVREGVSLGDVSTLGKMVVSGPDAVAALERIYPTTIADIRPGRSRYVLLLNERGHLIDDGMVCRETDTRFVLTFTSGGAAFAEMWMRDWVETWNLDVHILDRTLSLGAINVTGPLAGELLRRVGVDEAPKFLQHRHADVAGVPCHIMRLSFTGEASFELHHPITHSVELWRELMSAGRDLGIMPHGLQALFGLRLEKGHVIVGMDSELDSSPRRLNMEWAVKMEKPDFIGRTALARVADLPDHRRLFGLTMDGPAPTEGAPIYGTGSRAGEIIGHVASSFTSPLLAKAVMLGWQKHTPFTDTVIIDGREAHVTETPFYDPAGARARA